MPLAMDFLHHLPSSHCLCGSAWRSAFVLRVPKVAGVVGVSCFSTDFLAARGALLDSATVAGSAQAASNSNRGNAWELRPVASVTSSAPSSSALSAVVEAGSALPAPGSLITDLDCHIYASNSMKGFVPPPPCPTTFGVPFEEYYGEIIGEDYLLTQDTHSSLLHFLETLKDEKPTEELVAKRSRRLEFSSDTPTQSARERWPVASNAGPSNKLQPGVVNQALLHRTSISGELAEERSFSSQTTYDGIGHSALEKNVADAGDYRASVEKPSGRHSPALSSHGKDTKNYTKTVVDQSKNLPEFRANGGNAADDSGSSHSYIFRSTNSLVDVDVDEREAHGTAVEFWSRTLSADSSPMDGGASGNRMPLDVAQSKSMTLENLTSTSSFVDAFMHTQVNANVTHNIADAVSQSQFFEPKVSDVVLGIVISSDDQKFDIHIGAEEPALMPLKELRSSTQVNFENHFYKLPRSNDQRTLEEIAAPMGKSLWVEDETVCSVSAAASNPIAAGTVVISEVQAKSLLDGRAIVSGRAVSQKFALHRIKQLVQLGEAIPVEIVQYNEGGLVGILEGIRALLPRSELLQKHQSTASLNAYVGNQLSVMVCQVDEGTCSVLVSELKSWMKKNFLPGTVHDVTVTRVLPYGIQVEINDTRVRGFVHISNLSKDFVRSVEGLFGEGDKARVMLVRGPKPQQVSFSIAALESERGLILQDKQRVFREADDMAKLFRQGLTGQGQQVFSQELSEASLDCHGVNLTNVKWLF